MTLSKDISPTLSIYQLRYIDCPTLSELESFKKDECIKLIVKYGTAALATHNVSKSMTPAQLEVLASDIVKGFPDDPITFMKIFFRKVKVGDFGPTYGSIDEPTIYQWYKTWRASTIEAVGPDNVRASHQTETASDGIPCPDDIADRLAQKLKAFQTLPKQQSIPKPTQNEKERHDRFLEAYRAAQTDEEATRILERYSEGGDA